MSTCLIWCVFVFVILVVAIILDYIQQTGWERFNEVDQAAETMRIMYPKTNPGSELVIARYNEDLHWLNEIPIVQDIELITIYNKGYPMNINYINHKNVVVHDIPNVGRCDHTYLYHVWLRYDSLADVTVFLPGSADYAHKWEVSKRILQMSIPEKKTVMNGYNTNGYLKDSIYDFVLEEWEASQDKNKALNSEKRLHPAPVRPYGKWFEMNFAEGVNVYHITWYGIFAVSKQHVLQNHREHYEKFMRQLEVSSNPEVGHYTERSWAAIFHPIPGDCFTW